MKNIIFMSTLTMLIHSSLPAQSKKILFVMSVADTLMLNDGQKKRQTGVFLNEFYLAYKSVIENGYSVEFATPNGALASIDEESINDKYWKSNVEVKRQAIKFVHDNYAFNHPISLEKSLEKKEDYIGLIIPGGQGLMVDLIENEHIPRLLKYFALAKKPTGLICHAPSLLLTISKNENPYIGFKVNSVSTLEEIVIEKFIMKGKPKFRKIAKKLKHLGLKYKSGLPKADFAVKDRNLVTSQNPFSSNSFNVLYLQALSEFLNGI